MIKKVLVFIVILGLCASGVCEAKKSKKERMREELAQQRREKTRAIESRLDNTVWVIGLFDISPNAGKRKQAKIKDIIRFERNKVASDMLISEGFVPTNFSVSIKDENIIVWETMQTHPAGKGVAFWKGEIRQDSVRGTLSRHLGTMVRDYSFTGLSAGQAGNKK